MQAVITMAGQGKRFKDAGFDCPKYEIEVNGQSLFYWSMLSLRDISCREYFFVVRAEDKAENFIRTESKKLGIQPIVVELDKITSGQAETAIMAEKSWNPQEALLIYNIDTYIEAGEMKTKDFKGDGFIPCFKGKGDHWSFAKLGDDGSVVEVREKTRISDHCTVGAYYFKSAQLYKELYTKYYSRTEYLEKGERYIAPIYNQLIYDGGKIYINDIDVSKVHVLGTPEEVEEFRNNYQG